MVPMINHVMVHILVQWRLVLSDVAGSTSQSSQNGFGTPLTGFVISFQMRGFIRVAIAALVLCVL